MFPNRQPLHQHLSLANQRLVQKVGDIRQYWMDVGQKFGIDPFDAKAYFVLGMMSRHVRAANAVLGVMRHRGFTSAYALLGGAVELLGRCVHPDQEKRQHPVSFSGERLEDGFGYVRRQHLPLKQIVSTSHNDYEASDLRELRNLAAHGSCLATPNSIKGDIELLHELRKAIVGVLNGENDPATGTGPSLGGIDRYFNDLISNHDRCKRLADSAISPGPLGFQHGDWPFPDQVLKEMMDHIQDNLSAGRFPVSGGYRIQDDNFQLYS